MKSATFYKLAGLVVILMFSSAVRADFYLCIDGNGKKKYQDKECAAGEQTEEMELKHIGTLPAEETGSHKGSQTNLNRIQNAHFDTNLESWALASHSQRHAQAFSWIRHDGHQKSGAISVQSTPPVNPEKRFIYEVAMTQCVKLDRGKRYRFAASFKAMGQYKSRHANRVNLYWYQSEDCSTHGQFADYLEPNPDDFGWQRIKKENRLRSLNAKAALITIVQSRRAGNNTQVYWDDIELTPTEMGSNLASKPVVNHQYTLPPGQNYLKNPDFANNLVAWRYSGDTTWVSYAGGHAPGAARLAIFSDKGGYGAHSLSQCVNIGANKIFQAGAKAMVDPVSTQEGGGIFRLSWYEGENCQGRGQAGFKEDRVENINGWQELTIERIEAPPGAQSASIYITRGVNDSGLFAYFFDDVYFKALSE